MESVWPSEHHSVSCLVVHLLALKNDLQGCIFIFTKLYSSFVPSVDHHIDATLISRTCVVASFWQLASLVSPDGHTCTSSGQRSYRLFLNMRTLGVNKKRFHTIFNANSNSNLLFVVAAAIISTSYCTCCCFADLLRLICNGRTTTD